MKKTYIIPKIIIVGLRPRHLLSGSDGPTGNSQSNPNVSSAPRFKVFYDEEEEDF